MALNDLALQACTTSIGLSHAIHEFTRNVHSRLVEHTVTAASNPMNSFNSATPKPTRTSFKNDQPARTGYIGLSIFGLSFLLAHQVDWFRTPNGFFLSCACVFAVMAVIDLLIHKVYRQADVGKLKRVSAGGDLGLQTLLLKYAAIVASILIALTIYFLSPIYHDPWFTDVFRALRLPGILFFAGLLIYVFIIHICMVDKDDSLSNFGRFTLSLGKSGDAAEVKSFLLGLLIKVFFLPLMIGYGVQDWIALTATDLTFPGFRSFFEFSYRVILLIDVSFAVIGYSCSFRLLNAHVRWPELSIGGWLVCIICYAPFWQIINHNYIDYSDQIVWGVLFTENGFMYTLWGSTVLALMGVYCLSTVSFAYRFSNLTYRGTIRHGPYRIFRHPAYTCKNTAYWLVEIPFLGATGLDAISNTAALLAVNGIYYARAKFEERCCLKHEDYRNYYNSPAFVRLLNGVRIRPRPPWVLGRR